MIPNDRLTVLYETALNKIDAGVHVVDTNGKTLIYNRKMMEIEGMQIEDLLDKNIMEVFRFDNEEESTLLKVLRTQEPVYNIRQTYINNKGSEINTVNDSYPIFHNEELIGAIEIAKDVTKLERVVHDHLHRHHDKGMTFQQLIGNHPRFLHAVHQAKSAAASHIPILIIGEAGTGKETLAHCIHNESSVTNKLFVAESCDAYLEEQLEMLLFGEHLMVEETGLGLLKDRNIGTIYLDEITAIPLRIQRKILSFLENQERNNRLDNHDPYHIMPRLVIGTSEDPIDSISEGKFLKELYYYLGSMTIFLQPLRKRDEDLPLFIDHFLSTFNELFGTSVKSLTDDAIKLLHDYHWQGNIRELKYVMETAVKNTESAETIETKHLPVLFRNNLAKEKDLLIDKDKAIQSFDTYMQEAEIYYIQKALRLHNFNITKAASSLQMSRQNLQYRIRKHGLQFDK